MSKFWTLLGTLLAPALCAQELAGGPYAVHVGPRQGTIMWIVKDAAGLRAQKIALGNLAPNRRYDYDVMGRDAGKGSFKSAPEARASFTFAVFGDTRSRHEMHQRVVDALVQESPDFVVHTGDLVSDGRELDQWPRFFQIEKELLRRTAFFPVLGNHERNSSSFHEFFDIESPYYSFAWGAAHFTLLNSDVGNAVKTAEERAAWWAEQVRWLEKDLDKAQTADFRFVVLHHPPMTAVKRRLGQNEHVQELIPLFERHRVHAVFAGHDHNYQHHLRNGVRYIVTGGGGAPLYPVDAPDPELTRKVESAEHYVRVRVQGARARVEAIGLDGRQIDAFELRP